ncbi:MAG: serine protease [Clostridia bacterium]|nr:serine protease [Clostridia bacterium]
MQKLKFILLALLVVLVSVFAFVSCDGEDGDADHVHVYETTTVPASCTSKGYDLGVCTICQKETHSNYTEPKGHTLGEWEVGEAGSCTVKPTQVKKCLTCFNVVETKEESLKPHSFVQTEWSPTCKEQGYVMNTCTLCGFVEKKDFIPVTDEHKEGDWVVTKKASCLETGVQKKYCTVCQKELESATISISVHDFSTEYFENAQGTGGYTKYTCALCGHSKTLDHSSTVSPAVIYELISASMLRIEIYDKDGNRLGIGSGFFISGDGNVVTNYHVIKGAYSVKVQNYAGREYAVESVLGYNVTEDVAVINVQAENAPYLELSSTQDIKTGDPVYTLGSPLGVDNIFTTGIISNPALLVNGTWSIAFTAPISAGNSGGPLVNSEGKVIGINTKTATDGQNLNFAVMSERITELDTTAPKTVAQIYDKELSANAYKVLTDYIRTHKDGTMDNGNSSYIYKRIREATDSGYGLDCYFVYDSVTGTTTLTLYLLNNSGSGANRFEIQFIINDVSDSYELKLFDYNMGQYGLEAVVDPSVQANGTNRDDVMDVSILKYIDEAEYIKSLSYQGYMMLIDELNTTLNGSTTGLDLSYFNLKEPVFPQK